MSFGSLIVRHRDGRYETHTLTRATFTVGSANDNNLVIADPAVAPHHLQIVSDQRGSMVLDLGTSGGTALNKQRLDQAQHMLKVGDILKIGGTTIVVSQTSGQEDNVLEKMLGQEPDKTPKAPTPTPIAAAQAPMRPAEDRADISLKLSSDVLQVEAGKSMSLHITVRNRSNFVDQVDLEVEGVPAGWVTIRPETHNLYTQALGDSEILFHPPRSPQSEASSYPINIVATSRVDREARSAVPLTMTILPYTTYNLALDPLRRTATFEGGYDVRVTNNGNRLEQFRVVADDDADQVGFRFAPSTLRVPPGDTRSLRMRARAQKIKLVGSPVNHEFTVGVEPVSGGAEMQTVRGTFAQQPPFSTWLVAGLVGLLLLSCIGFAIWLAIPPINGYFVARAQTATTVASTTAWAQQVASYTSDAKTSFAQGTAAAERATDRAITAGNPQTAEALQRTSDAEILAIRQTSDARNEQAIAARLTAAAQAANLQRTIDARLPPTAVTQVISQIIPPSATPIYTATQTIEALPFAMRETVAAEQTMRADAEKQRAAAVQTQTSFAGTVTALAITPETMSEIILNDLGDQPQEIGGFQFQDKNIYICFFRAWPAPIPSEPGGDMQIPTYIPTYSPTPTPTGTTIISVTGHLNHLAMAEATPRAGSGFNFRSLAQPPQTPPCMPQFAQTLIGVAQTLGPDVLTENVTSHYDPSVGGANVAALTSTESGEPHTSRAVAVVVFLNPVDWATVKFWHPFGVVSGYRLYGLDTTGVTVDLGETGNLISAGEQNLTVDGRAFGRRVGSVILIGLDSSQPSDLRFDLLTASQPVFLQSVIVPK